MGRVVCKNGYKKSGWKGRGQDEGNSFAKKDVWLHARAKGHVRDAGVSAYLFKKGSRRERRRTRGGRGGGSRAGTLTTTLVVDATQRATIFAELLLVFIPCFSGMGSG